MSNISKETARAMISHYKELRSRILNPEYSTDILPICITIPKSEIEDMLAQSSATKLRVYLGADEASNEITTILVAADANDEDIIGSDPIIVDTGRRCPPDCPPASEINP